MTVLKVDNIRNGSANLGISNTSGGRMDPYRFQFPNVSSLPSGAEAGDTYFLTSDNKLYTSKGDDTWAVKSGFSQPSGTFEYGWSSSSSTGNYTASPINVWYRRIIFQTKYTASELNSNGAESGAIFRNLKLYVTGSVNSSRSIRDMRIKMFHTNQGTNTTYSPISGESKTDVFYQPGEFTLVESTGEKTMTFGAGGTNDGFEWNGSNDLVIEWCTSQNQTVYNPSGQIRYVSQSGYNRYRWTDSGGNSCGDTPSSNTSVKPSIKMDFF